MAKQKFKVGDRVMITDETMRLPNQSRFATVDFVSGKLVDLVLDGPDEDGEVSVTTDQIQKVSPDAGSTPEWQAGMTRDQRMHVLGVYTAYLVGRDTPAEELAEKLREAATTWGLL